MNPWHVIAVIIGSYLFGNINFSVIISRSVKKRDIRTLGSGNPGTMNMVRNYGVPLGALTLLLDAVKAAIPAVVGWYVLGGFSFFTVKTGAFIAGLAVVIGHIYPFIFKFKGGKGVACAIGVSFVAEPLVAAIAFVASVIFLFTVKYGFLASFIAIGTPLIFEGIITAINGQTVSSVLCFVIFAVILFAHRGNIMRFFRGKEPKTYVIKSKRPDNGESTLKQNERQDGK